MINDNSKQFYLLHAGQFSGFDTEQPTSESGGKPRVVASLKEKRGFQNLVMVGDGATDMEASPPAVRFLPFFFFSLALH